MGRRQRSSTTIELTADYRTMLALVRRPTMSIMSMRKERKSVDMSLETYMSYGLGSGVGGRPISYVTCSNDRASGVEKGRCTMAGHDQLACAQCSLVKYCSGRCQRQHWPKHRIDCESKLNQYTWQPNWIEDNRPPKFNTEAALSHQNTKAATTGLWGCIPGYDILSLRFNEGLAVSMHHDYKLCFSGGNDLRNLIRTVNSLPTGYQGKCDILFNDSNPISSNRNLLILFVLLTPGPSAEEAAELALHIMYSSRLTTNGAAYVNRCVHLIYGESAKQIEMTFQRSFQTRGRGMIHSTQPANAIKRPLEMFMSRYELSKAMRRMKDVLLDPAKLDDRHKVLSNLDPAHRLAHVHFWKTGILAPYSFDLSSFTEPNRAAFTAQGSWLGQPDDVSPLQGWDIGDAQTTGRRYGLEAAGDIFGCLFFHVKHELREFINRVKSFNINIHHSQYDSRVLSKGIEVGVLPSFHDIGASFDRIDLGRMPDRLSLRECLQDWAPLVKKTNAHACLVMSFEKWSEAQGGSMTKVPLSNPETVLQILKRRCRNIPSLGPRLKKLLEQGLHSPSMIRLIESLDVFVDSGPPFQEYLQAQGLARVCDELGIRQRRRNRVHPKRFGITLDMPAGQILPDISRQEYYNIFTLARGDLLTRFAEFELLYD